MADILQKTISSAFSWLCIPILGCKFHWKLEQLDCLRSEIPLVASWLPILMIHIRSQVKVTNFKKLPKIEILPETLHATHLLKLLDKMYKYEISPTGTVGTTERTRDAGRTDGRTDRRTDGWTEWNQYTPQQLRCAGGIIILNIQLTIRRHWLRWGLTGTRQATNLCRN